MRIILFITLFFFAFVSKAFSDSFPQSSSKGLLTEENFQKESGFYTGLSLGGQFGHSRDKTGSFGYNADNEEWSYHESGVNAAEELGYYYLSHQLMIGPEIELGYLGTGGKGTQPSSPGSDTVGKSSSNLYTAFRARAGFYFDRNLIFATGGAIGVNYVSEVIDSCNIAPCGGNTIHAKKTDFVWGYIVGGGVEHWFNKNWSVKLESLYFNLENQNFSGTTSLGNTYDWTGKTSGYIIRSGFNYYF